MSKHSLVSQIRTVTGRKVKALRKSGLTPAVVYGKKTKTESIQVNTKEFVKLFSQIGESTLIYLGDRPTLVRDVTYDAVTGLPLHVDFLQVDLKEKVKANVPVKLIGESPAEKEKLGVLVQQLEEIEVEALPTDMPEHIEVDVTILAEVDQAIHVKDLKISSKVEVLSDGGQIIAKIEPMAKEEPVAVAEVEAVPADTVAPAVETPASS
ncbi:MAG: 50S ribosomal protein L25 [Patescibacteria group bacterium]